MQYLMKFQTKDSIIDKISDVFPKSLDIQELKDRFNESFIKNKECSAVVMYFIKNNLMKSFIAGFRNQQDGSQKVCIIDMQTNKEYSPKEFSNELNILAEALKK